MKNTIKIIFLFVCLSSFSQGDRKEMREKIKAEKIAFFTEKLSLTETEAAKFWPIYNKHEDVRRSVKTKYYRPMRQAFRKNKDVSEAEALKMLDNLIIAENKMHEAKVNMVNNLKGKIPALKIIKLKSVEDAFNRKLLERLKKSRNKKSKD